jgi:hypothetical protein
MAASGITALILGLMAEVAASRQMLADILSLIARPRAAGTITLARAGQKRDPCRPKY